MKREKKGSKQERKMVLVDAYYIPADIAEQYQLLREHCATEVLHCLQEHFTKVDRITLDEEVGEVIAAYDVNCHLKKVVALDPIGVSKLEKAVSANRLERYLMEEITSL